MVKDGGVDEERVVGFLVWLGRCAQQDVSLGDGLGKVTPSIWKNSGRMLYNEVSAQLGRYVEKGFYSKLPSVKVAETYVNERSREVRLGSHSLGETTSDLVVNFDQMVRMQELSYAVDDRLLRSFSITGVLNTAAVVRITHSQANRGEDLRSARLGFMTFLEYDSIPGLTGVVMKNVSGKTLSAPSSVQFTAQLPHRNPLLCGVTALSATLVYRYVSCDGEFPSVRDPASYKYAPLLLPNKACPPSLNAIEWQVQPHVLRDAFHRLFSASGVEVHSGDPITHQGRHQAQVEAAKAMVPEMDAKRACNYERQVREKTYSVLIPLSWQLSRAGYDFRDPQSLAAHLRVRLTHASQLTQLVDLMLPRLSEEEAEISKMRAEILLLPLDRQEAARKACKLRSGDEFLRWFRYQLEIFILSFAARQRGRSRTGGYDQILHDTPPLYKLFQDSPFVKSINLSCSGQIVNLFETPLFVEIAEAVAAEEEEADVHTPKRQRIANAVSHHIAPMQQEVLRRLDALSPLDTVDMEWLGSLPEEERRSYYDDGVLNRAKLSSDRVARAAEIADLERRQWRWHVQRSGNGEPSSIVCRPPSELSSAASSSEPSASSAAPSASSAAPSALSASALSAPASRFRLLSIDPSMSSGTALLEVDKLQQTILSITPALIYLKNADSYKDELGFKCNLLHQHVSHLLETARPDVVVVEKYVSNHANFAQELSISLRAAIHMACSTRSVPIETFVQQTWKSMLTCGSAMPSSIASIAGDVGYKQKLHCKAVVETFLNAAMPQKYTDLVNRRMYSDNSGLNASDAICIGVAYLKRRFPAIKPALPFQYLNAGQLPMVRSLTTLTNPPPVPVVSVSSQPSSSASLHIPVECRCRTKTRFADTGNYSFVLPLISTFHNATEFWIFWMQVGRWFQRDGLWKTRLSAAQSRQWTRSIIFARVTSAKIQAGLTEEEALAEMEVMWTAKKTIDTFLDDMQKLAKEMKLGRSRADFLWQSMVL